MPDLCAVTDIMRHPERTPYMCVSFMLGKKGSFLKRERGALHCRVNDKVVVIGYSNALEHAPNVRLGVWRYELSRDYSQ
jgi:hypothetical protein